MPPSLSLFQTPPLTLLTGPAGSGKTARCLERLRGAGTRVLLIVPSTAVADRLRERLKEQDPDADGSSICTFTDVVETLAKDAARRTRPMSEAMRRFVLADLFAAEIPDDGYFGRMHGTRGFVPALADSLREWKLSGISPDDLETAALSAPDPDDSFLHKTAEMARLYRAYERFLRDNGWHDEEDLHRFAVEAVENGAKLPGQAREVIADGFFRFTCVWRDLLAAIGRRGVPVTVTLPLEAVRPLLFATPLRTRAQFVAGFDVTEQPLPPRPGANPALTALERGLFGESDGWTPSDEGEPRGAPRPLGPLPPILGSGRGEPESAASMPARPPESPNSGGAGTDAQRPDGPTNSRSGSVPPELGTGGQDGPAPAGDPLGTDGTSRPLGPFDSPILGSGRDVPLSNDPTTQRPNDPEWGGGHSLPASASDDSPLTTHYSPDTPVVFDAPNPYAEVEMVVRALRRERDEHGTPWERCAIVARSVGGYASLLESVCDRYGVPVRFVQGRPLLENPLVRSIDHLLAVWADRWRRDDVIALLKGGFAPVPVEHADRLRIQARKRALREGRDAWERLLGDPAEKQGSWGAFIAALSETDTVLHAGRLSVEEVRAALTGFLERVGWSAEKQREDAGALKKALSILDDLAEHDRQRGAPPAAFAELRQRLRRAWQSASWAPRPEPGCVTVLEPYDLGQARASWVAVIGLTERVFPRRPGEDPFLRDDERALLREQGLDLEIRGERGDDERLLFYLAVTAPSDRLLLSFPRASDESDTLPSFYLDEVRAALPHLPSVVRTLADVAPHPDECVDDRDRLLSACADAADTPGPPERPEVHGLAAVQSTRDLPPVPALGAEALGAYAAPHRLSVSEVESYNRCPFQHLMQYGLRLRAEEDGARDRDKGILLHAALRRTLRRQKEEDRRPDAAALMEELCQDLGACLDGYPVDAPAHRRAMMEQAVTDALAGFSEREALLREQFGLAAAHFELAFGMEAETPDEEGRSREYDAASSPVPLRLEVEEGRAVELCGAIDRVDLMEDGKRAIVVDYKIGKGAEWPAVKAGESIQMPLYLMAVEQVFGMTPVAACYDSARDGGRRRFIRRDQLAAAEQRVFGPAPGEDGRMVKPVGPDEYTEAADNAVDAVRRAVLGIASGRVLPRPGDHCRWCDYGDICRAQSGTHDGAPLPVEEPPM